MRFKRDFCILRVNFLRFARQATTAPKTTQTKTSTTKTNTTTKTNSTVTVTKNKTTSSVSNTKRDSFEFSSETTKQLLMKPSPVNTSSHEKNTYPKDSTTIANVLKGTGTGLNNNPLSNTKYKIDLSINTDHPQRRGSVRKHLCERIGVV